MDAATSAKLKAFNQHYYTPENMTLVVVGPVEPPKVRALVDRIFGIVPATGYKAAPAPVPRPLSGVSRADGGAPGAAGLPRDGLAGAARR